MSVIRQGDDAACGGSLIAPAPVREPGIRDTVTDLSTELGRSTTTH